MVKVVSELNVVTIPPPERHPRIFRTFEALKPGEAFVLVNDHNPKPLLYQFQFEFPGGYEWNILEAGPVRYRVEIARRSGPPQRTATEYMQTDHRRLDSLLAEVDSLAGEGRFDEALSRFGEFACGLFFHIEREERILFPFFDQKTGTSGQGPTAAMKAEHEEICRCPGRIRSAIESKDRDAVSANIRALMGVLSPHNLKEEHVLYPTSDECSADPRERDDLVKRMQAL